VALRSAKRLANQISSGTIMPEYLRIFIGGFLLLVWAGVSDMSLAAVAGASTSRDSGTSVSADEARKRIEVLDSKIINKPDSAALYLERAQLYLERDENEKALGDYNKAIALKPDLDQAWYGRGLVYGRLGQLDKAIVDMSEFVRRRPNDSMGYTKRGVRYMWAGEVDKAFADYKKALALNANNAEAHDDIGVIYANRQDFKSALGHFGRAIEIDPLYQKAYYNRALTLLLMGEEILALSDIERSLELKADDRSALKLKAVILKSLGHAKAAKKADALADTMTERSWHEQHELSR
jgi:tetratricopeptide (TPR) repeat protein